MQDCPVWEGNCILLSLVSWRASKNARTYTHTRADADGSGKSIAVVCGCNLLTVSFTKLTRSFQRNIDWQRSTSALSVFLSPISPLACIHQDKIMRVFISSARNDFIYAGRVFRYSRCAIFICLDILGFDWASVSKGWFLHVMGSFWVLWPAVKPSCKKKTKKTRMQPPAPVKAGVHKHRSLKISLTCVRVHHVKRSHSVKGMTAQAQSQGQIHTGLLRVTRGRRRTE